MTDLSNQYAFGWIKSLAEGTGFLMGPAFAIATTAVTIYLIIGGLRFLLSGGDKNAVSGARNMIIHAIIGFILLMVLFLIVQFIYQFLGLGSLGILQ